ncbi:MAG: lpxB [Caulobacteraceae bacterium]|nr:lpxB [Caulobacteraceae bacterium]
MKPITVMLVAAEASGDSLGAGLARALRARLGDRVRFVGVGGAKMAREGVASPFDITQLSVLGLLEGLAAYPRVLARVKDAAELARREKPDVAILIDSWGFNLRMARALRRVDPQMLLVKYVGPQIWASRPGRARTLAGAVDHLLTIHAFDQPLFEAAGLKTTFVGNPALAKDFSQADPRRLRHTFGLEPQDRVLLVLPGSRPGEVARVLPPFGQAAIRLKAERPDLTIMVGVAPSVDVAVKQQVTQWPIEVRLIEDDDQRDDAMVAATFAIACSGTVTTELGLAGCPMVVGYRLGKLTHAILRHMIRTPWIVLMNIAARRFVVPELVQDQCTADNIVREALARLDDETLRQAQIADQYAALELMGRGQPDPSSAAADAVVALLA